MVFTSPSWVPPMVESPDTLSLPDFLNNNEYRDVPLEKAKNPFTCGISGRTFTALEQKQRIQWLTSALQKELGWAVNEGSEWDKVVGIFSLNTVDSLTAAFATHYLNGIVSPANAAYNADELTYQMKSAGAKAIFTCIPLLETTLVAAKACGIPQERIYILEMAEAFTGKVNVPFKTVDQLIEQGKKLAPVEKARWTKGQGGTQTAFLCYSSGTSGLPKGVMISHRNCIHNVLQISVHEKITREKKGSNGLPYMDVGLGLLPFSHIYGLVVISLATTHRGDEIIVLPKFEMASYLTAIQRFKINTLYLVPPIIIAMINNPQVCGKFDLSSVVTIFTGAAPLGKETAEDIQKQYPKWIVRQGYGLTETSTVVCSTSEEDVVFGTSGSLLRGFKAKIITPEGKEITAYNEPGELVVQSHSVVLGYLNNDKANKETFLPDEDGNGRWMRTGDEAIVTLEKSGHEHITIVDRIKELIKVKGMQVAPAELEAFLLTHPYVADVAVIPVPDDRAGEVPKAFIVKSGSVSIEENDRIVKREIQKYVEENKSRHKWIAGGIEFIDVVPKSPSGKILRRLLRDKEKEARRAKGAKL